MFRYGSSFKVRLGNLWMTLVYTILIENKIITPLKNDTDFKLGTVAKSPNVGLIMKWTGISTASLLVVIKKSEIEKFKF